MKLYDQAIDGLRMVAQGSHHQNAIEASFLIASVHDTRGDTASAMSTRGREPVSGRSARGGGPAQAGGVYAGRSVVAEQEARQTWAAAEIHGVRGRLRRF
jgi:hypothetical protein